MTALIVTWSDITGLKRFDNMLKALGPKDMTKVAARAINHTGGKARTQVIRELTRQTGLKRKVIVKALKVRRATWSDLNYVMLTQGGDISLKYFAPKETRRGVSAKPWGKATRFPGTFMHGGRFPNRRFLFGRLGGHVWQRAGSERLPIEKVDSGVYIPREMIGGATREAFEKVVSTSLPQRLEHEIKRVTDGAMS